MLQQLGGNSLVGIVAADHLYAAACPNTNFLKGVKWSPDGSCCLTCSDDNRYEDHSQHEQLYQVKHAQQPALYHSSGSTAHMCVLPAMLPASVNLPESLQLLKPTIDRLPAG